MQCKGLRKCSSAHLSLPCCANVTRLEHIASFLGRGHVPQALQVGESVVIGLETEVDEAAASMTRKLHS